MKSVIIQGSSRSEGNTNKIAQILQQKLDAEIIDLKKLKINSYSYEHEHRADDFLKTMRSVVTYDLIIFLTPVYWYSMSGIMKNFFDRITDCLQIEKETGRSLKGKNMIAVSCGSDDEETAGFFIPFKNSAEYLDMNYLGDIHTWIEDENPEAAVITKLESFIKEIEKALSAP